MAGTVKLRPLEAGDLEILRARENEPESAGEHAWHGFRTRSEASLETERGYLADGNATIAVCVDDEFVGTVGWFRVDYGPGGVSNCWNVGIWLLPEARGRGYGSEAQHQLVEYLFSHTRVERIEASTDIENVAEQRALENAGFAREGVLRSAQFRYGEWHDMVVYGVVRSEWTGPA